MMMMMLHVILAPSCLMMMMMTINLYSVNAFQGWTKTSRRRSSSHGDDIVLAITTAIRYHPPRKMSLPQQHEHHETDLDDGNRATLLLERNENDISTMLQIPLPPPHATVVASSSSLGKIWRISMPGQKEQDSSSSSFVGSMGVPTFAATGGKLIHQHENNDQRCAAIEFYNLQDSLGQGPAFLLTNVLHPNICQDIINTCEQQQKQSNDSNSSSNNNNNLFGSYNTGKNHHGAMQIVVSKDMIQPLGKRIEPYINLQEVQDLQRQMMMNHHRIPSNHENDTTKTKTTTRLKYAGLNQRWRIYRYAPSGQERFAPHIDAAFPPSGLSHDGQELIWDISSSSSSRTSTSTSTSSTTTTTISHLTILFYLNDDFDGGETNFYQPLAQQQQPMDHQLPKIIACVKPVTGSCLVFPQGVGEDAVEYARQHWPLHEGAPVLPFRQLQQSSSSSSSRDSSSTGIDNLYNPLAVTGTVVASSPKYVIRSDILLTSVPSTM